MHRQSEARLVDVYDGLAGPGVSGSESFRPRMNQHQKIGRVRPHTLAFHPILSMYLVIVLL